MPKTRPLVDPSVFDFAQQWISRVYVINGQTADDVEDACWELADRLQHELESWCGDAEAHGRLRVAPHGG